MEFKDPGLDGRLWLRWLRAYQAIPSKLSIWSGLGGDAARLDMSIQEENLRRLDAERREIVPPPQDGCAPKVARRG